MVDPPPDPNPHCGVASEPDERSHNTEHLATRAIAMLVLASCAVLCAAHSRGVIVWWATGVARRGSPDACRLGVMTLERTGDAGIPTLILLATDLRPLPVTGGGQYADLVPPDAVCDVALDALRRMRTQSSGARTLEWNASADVPTYQHALMAYRLAELDRALQWWSRRRARNAAPAP